MCEVTGALKAISGEKFKRKIRFYFYFIFLLFSPSCLAKRCNGFLALWRNGNLRVPVKKMYIFSHKYSLNRSILPATNVLWIPERLCCALILKEPLPGFLS